MLERVKFMWCLHLVKGIGTKAHEKNIFFEKFFNKIIFFSCAFVSCKEIHNYKRNILSEYQIFLISIYI